MGRPFEAFRIDRPYGSTIRWERADVVARAG
jgi:hypothetical protein